MGLKSYETKKLMLLLKYISFLLPIFYLHFHKHE